MSKRLIYFCGLFFLIAMIGCQKDESPGQMPGDGNPEPEPDFVVEEIIPSGEEQYLNLDSDYIYNQEKLPTFEINLPRASLEQIDADPAAEEYVEASLTFEGETISPVGLRYKGSIGAFVDCLSGRDWANPSGSKICTKLSMKVKINWEGREEKFYGLKKLQFHSQNLDNSHMRERLGYWLFREMGVPAPRSVHARLYINGVYSGLYALTEQIDGRFTRYNFEDGKGNLYKEIWPLRDNGQPFSEQEYINHLKTNEDENPTAELMRSFANAVASASEEELPEVIDEWMDVDQIIAYGAVDRTIRNDDGAFHWYCSGGGCAPHNFYWYEETDEEKLHLIPWDLDNAFENIISNANPVTPIVDGWGETSNDCEPFPFGFLQVMQRSAACDKLTRGWSMYPNKYQQKLATLKSGPMMEADAKLDKWAEQVRVAIVEANELHEDAISVTSWENALNQIRNQINFARTQ